MATIIYSNGERVELDQSAMPSHLEQVQILYTAKPELTRWAVVFLAELLGTSEDAEEAKFLSLLRSEAEINPDWWISHHHGGMRNVRNALRSAGFGEKEFGCGNLDDYAVGLVELAWEIGDTPWFVRGKADPVLNDGSPWAVSDMLKGGGAGERNEQD